MGGEWSLEMGWRCGTILPWRAKGNSLNEFMHAFKLTPFPTAPSNTLTPYITTWPEEWTPT